MISNRQNAATSAVSEVAGALGSGGSNSPSPDDSRPLDSILEEYADRVEQLHRLEDELAQTTDPAMREFLEGQIETQRNIIADLTEEALSAGANFNGLGELSNEAAAAAAANPIELEEFHPEWVIDDFVIDGTKTFGGEIGSIGVGFAAIFNDVIGNDLAAQQQYQWAYENGPLGLTEDPNGDFHTATRGFLAVATVSAGSALIIGGAEFAFLGNVSVAEINVLSGGNVFKILSRPFRGGFRIDPAHHGKPWGHMHLWKWKK